MTSRRPGFVAWLAVLGGGALLEAWLLLGPLSRVSWHSALGLFIIVTVAASLCAVAALPVLVRAHRTNNAEMGLLGAAMFNLSVLPLVHGLTTPGVWYGPNAAATTSVLLAGPVAVLTCTPLVTPRSALGLELARRWRTWSNGCMAGGTLLAAALLLSPDVIPAPPSRSFVPMTIMVCCFTMMAAVSWRELRLYWISRHRAFLGASLAVAFITLTSTVWMGRQPFTVGWWTVHALDITGVFGVLGSLWLAPQLRQTVVDVLQPVLVRDPLVAFEIGLAPIVHQFVAALQGKDRITSDHVVRVGELAGRSAEALHLPAVQLRNTILAAILHDIGKLGIDDAVLTKPGPLTDEEYRVVQRHTIIGGDMLRSVPSLAAVAPIVRAHHERPDGAGYPDGLSGDQVPLEARIIAACDAYDAMTNTRHYRQGMGHERAVAILEEYAGSQWDRHVVEVVKCIAAKGTTGIFDVIGDSEDAFKGCSCPDALPEAVQTAFV